MEETRSFAPLLVVVVLAFLVPLLLSGLRRFTLPIVVGEIIAGILVGRSGMGWINPMDPVLTMLAEFGFVFLMFLSGMEIDFRALVGYRSEEAEEDQAGLGMISLGGLTFCLTLLMSIAAAYGLYALDLVRNPWVMALILSTTSLGVIVPVLKERGISAKPLGQSILVAAVIADFATMLLITVVVAVMSHGWTARILLLGVLFLAFFLMHRFGIVLNRIAALRRTFVELSHATAQIKVRAAFTTMLIFVVLSEALGAEVVLGAFLAGAIVSLLRTPEDEVLVHQLDAIGFGFFIPIFFIMVGAELDLPMLYRSEGAVMLVPLLLAAAVTVKVVPALAFRINFNMRDTLAAGALLSARLSLIIAAAAIGKRLGVISEPVSAAIVLVAIITVTLAPFVFVRLIPGRGPTRLQPILVVGANELGLRVADHLKAHHEPVVIVDYDQERVARASQRGFEAVKASVDRRNTRAGNVFEAARAVVCTYEDVKLAYRVCQLAKEVFDIEHVVTQVTDPKDLPSFDDLGVSTVNAALDRAALIVLLARNPALYSLLSRTDDDKEVCEVVVQNRQHVGKKIHQLDLPGDVLALTLRRNGELTVPHGETRVIHGDRLTLLGSVEDIDLAQQMFGRGGKA